VSFFAQHRAIAIRALWTSFVRRIHIILQSIAIHETNDNQRLVISISLVVALNYGTNIWAVASSSSSCFKILCCHLCYIDFKLKISSPRRFHVIPFEAPQSLQYRGFANLVRVVLGQGSCTGTAQHFMKHWQARPGGSPIGRHYHMIARSLTLVCSPSLLHCHHPRIWQWYEETPMYVSYKTLFRTWEVPTIKLPRYLRIENRSLPVGQETVEPQFASREQHGTY
jgi:hypothetical protein